MRQDISPDMWKDKTDWGPIRDNENKQIITQRLAAYAHKEIQKTSISKMNFYSGGYPN